MNIHLRAPTVFRRRRMTCCVGCLEARHQDTADNDGQVLLREGVCVSLVFITWDPTASCVTVCISDWRVSPELSVGEHAASLKKRSPISGWTALMIAAESGHVDCTQELLESGAEKAGGVWMQVQCHGRFLRRLVQAASIAILS